MLASAVLIAGAVFTALKFKKPPAENLLPANSAGKTPAAGAAAFMTYVHPDRGFSFDYPADWSAEAFAEDGEGEIVAVQNAETGILIFIYPFNESGPITKERVLRDVPDMKIQNEIQLKLGNGIDAFGFDSSERDIGPTKEVWFVCGGFLYQIAAAEGSGETLSKMAETWKIQK